MPSVVSSTVVLVSARPIHAVLLPALMLFLIGAGMGEMWAHSMRAYAEARHGRDQAAVGEYEQDVRRPVGPAG